MNLPLPPLPPFVPEGEPDWVPNGRSLVDVLNDDHDRMLTLADQLDDESCDDERRRQVGEVLLAMVSRHISAEQQYLYPTVRAVIPDGDQLADQEIATETALQRALKSQSGGDGRTELLRDHVRRHADLAATRLLPEVAEAVSDEDLIRLGNRAVVVAEEAPTRPHPGTPAAPPWNKVVDTGVGVVDKILDAVTGRPTRPEDLPDPEPPAGDAAHRTTDV